MGSGLRAAPQPCQTHQQAWKNPIPTPSSLLEPTGIHSHPTAMELFLLGVRWVQNPAGIEGQSHSKVGVGRKQELKSSPSPGRSSSCWPCMDVARISQAPEADFNAVFQLLMPNTHLQNHRIKARVHLQREYLKGLDLPLPVPIPPPV